MNIKAHKIKYALKEKHTNTDDFFATEVKNGPTHFNNELAIIDGLAIKKSWVKPCITGYEIKVSRNDFMSDDKWPSYKEMCHRLYFVCPKGLIKPDELPEDVGLIWYNPEKRSLYTRKKSLFRDIEMPYEMLYYIIMSRLTNQEHPFFDNNMELFQDYVEHKRSAKQLGSKVSSKLIDQVAELEEQNSTLQRRMISLEKKEKRLIAVEEVLAKHGIRTFAFTDLAEEIDEALRNSIPHHLLRDIEEIKNKSERVLNNIFAKESG